ncbi:hypothetical protein JZ751_018050 [Albula glossodonta]|uniref:Uncharacterized protein n=1 Tax=Albula glossodonta TaxID=121402 RepID=A0A8T2PQ24_9TELE|nr:hypothetical protein JZ751_018050 [Albula glossodonta]
MRTSCQEWQSWDSNTQRQCSRLFPGHASYCSGGFVRAFFQSIEIEMKLALKSEAGAERRGW